MPFYRRFKKGSIYRKRRRTYGRRKFRRVFKKAVKRVVHKMAETKQKDLQFSPQSIPFSNMPTATGGYWIYPTADIARGTESFDRIGDRITISSMEVAFKINIAAASQPTKVRCILFQRTDYRTVASIGDTTTDLTAFLYPPAVNDWTMQQRNPDVANFHILIDKTYGFDSTTGNVIAKTWKIRKLKYLKKTIMYNAGLTTSATNHIGMVFFHNSGVSPTVAAVWRTRFIDM